MIKTKNNFGLSVITEIFTLLLDCLWLILIRRECAPHFCILKFLIKFFFIGEYSSLDVSIDFR